MLNEGRASVYATSSTVKKKMSFRQKFRNWLFDDETSTKSKTYYEDASPNIYFESGMNFTIHKASGGLVVNVHRYDNERDRSKSSLYVISDDDQIGDSISKILTMENLIS